MMASQAIREKILKMMLTSHADRKFVVPLRFWGLKGERTTTLRYCEGCLAEWIENQQVPYWRIDHQLAGVYCCVKHACILKSVSKVRSRCYFDQTILRLINDSDERVIKKIVSSGKKAIEDIAKRSAHQQTGGGIGKSTNVYRDMFKEAGFVRAGSQIKHLAVISAWSNYFGQEYCHLTNMTAGRISKLLDRLSEISERFECSHPFMFIAGESFLAHHLESSGAYLPRIGCRALAFAAGREVVAPVLAAFSCNGALHRSADVLEFVQSQGDRWKLVCTCGVSYGMRKAARIDATQFVPVSYEARYRKQFRALIANGVNASCAARELRLAINTANRWAYRERVGDIEALSEREVRKLRSTWRQLVKNAPPERRITGATEANPAVFKELLKNDWDWFCAFNRSQRSPSRTKGLVRLKEPTADQILEAWRGLKSADPPIMVSRSAILERSGFPRIFNRKRPFEAILAELVERRPAYLERVISWLANLASGQRQVDYDEAIQNAGLRRSSFSKEQRERIREIELMSSVEGCSDRECELRADHFI
ncbi:hypothetical protein PMI06_000845 [Burkholderia sp. BT03]|nr:hypothetical protein PMI06_000845 [Burkholderia sp. BT03]SKD07857.1 TniQ protein [Paraburkholderia hospita]